MKTKKTSLLIGLLFFSIFYIFALIGLLDDLNQILNQVISSRPLPKYYFTVYVSLGLLLPLILRLVNTKLKILRDIVDSYILLLLSQILTEVVLVLSIGKGIGVLIGLVFSALRVVQLQQLLSMLKRFNFINIFLYFELFLWTINILQIVFNRLLFIGTF